MHTIPPPALPVKSPTALRQYARALLTYPATMTDQYGTIHGTCRELYTHGGCALEWQAAGYADRRIVRRTDPRLHLEEHTL